MAKVLVTVHLGRHFRIFGHYDYQVLLDMGHEVHIAANFNDPIDQFEDSRVTKHQIDFNRNPFHKENINAYKQLKKLFKEHYFELIHCQSPSGGVITRLAARKTRRNNTKVVYTAHGLHFFKGAPIKNWLVYFTIEKVLGMYTDTIITINSEDYLNSKDKLKIKNVEYIHGVGIDINKYTPQTITKKNEIRAALGYNENDYIIICVGELSYRKHQDLIICAVGKLKNKIPNLKLLLVGMGNLLGKYKELAEQLEVIDQVQFLGYRNDVNNLMMVSDVAVSTSRQEGLPVNILEGMATGLPIIVTNCRGNRDLITNDENGYIVEPNDLDSLIDKVEKLMLDKQLQVIFGENSLLKIKQYSINKVAEDMTDIYNEFLKNDVKK